MDLVNYAELMNNSVIALLSVYGILFIFQLVLLVLKVGRTINWSWLIVLSPIFWFIIFYITFLIAGVVNWGFGALMVPIALISLIIITTLILVGIPASLVIRLNNQSNNNTSEKEHKLYYDKNW